MTLISIVLPTYKEKENLGILFSEIRKKVAVEGYEVVVVDDNSPDGTWAEALNYLGARDVVVRRMNMRGLSSAIIDGISFSSTKYAVVMDSDLQHPPEAINSMVSKLMEGDCDVVIGSRYMVGGGIVGWSRTRLLISKGATAMSKLFLPYARKVTDPMSGFFMVKRSLVVENRGALNPMGFKILLEILERCRPSRIAEIPYTFRSRVHGESKLGSRTIIAFVLHVLRLCGWRPLKFLAVGASGAFINMLTLWTLAMLFPVLAEAMFVIGSAIAIEVSTLWNFGLHEIWTFRDRRVGSLARRLALFHIAVLPGVVVQYALAVSIRYGLSVNPLMSQLVGILVGFPVNYILSELGIWKSYREL